MLFNSLSFLIFFPVTTALYFVLPHRVRWAMLLAVSALFYASFIPRFLLVLLGVILVDYTAARLIEAAEGTRRRLLLVVSLAANLGILGAFKYAAFFNENIRTVATALHWHYDLTVLAWVLPVGLSFHTFQSMAYTIEVYRRRFPAERHLGLYALYVLFYPQLVAGPIERPAHLLPQFRTPQRFDPDRVFDGLRLMLWGLFKKMVIADRMALIVDLVYKTPGDYGGGWVVVATWLFAIQIYCDFSGYSDTAIGAARVLGIDLGLNFDRPYESRSVQEFWRRWHISLSSWFRDYVYIPLGGSRVGPLASLRNVAVVFVLSGLWHGANWTYVVWGALHGLYLVVARLTSTTRDRVAGLTGLDRHPAVRRGLAMVVTFQLVAFAWLFFRAASLGDAAALLARLGTGPLFACPDPDHILRMFSLSREGHLLIAGLLIALMLGVEHLGARHEAVRRWDAAPVWVRWPAYYALILVILWMGDLGGRSFIYFQF